MNPAELQVAVKGLVESAAADRGAVLTLSDADVVLERPRSREHGDWASTVAMRVGKRIGIAPRDLAAELAEGLQSLSGVAAVEVAGPGFINITLEAAAAGELARRIVTEGEAFGRSTVLDGLPMNLEFVSANPTGPIHLGGTRWAAVGDSLARILEAQGAAVTREYYFNDHGAQIDRFSNSLVARYLGEPVPEDGYGGGYIADIAERVASAYDGDLKALPRDEAQEVFRRIGVDLMFGEIKQSLHDFGVDFDVYFHENDLYESGAVEHAVARLRELGHIYEADGATWLRTTDFGDDRDRVVLKSNGEAAYIAGDLAYYLNKRERGFERCLIMLGADHHGYIGRLMAMVAAFGDTPCVNLEVLIGQMVNLLRDGVPVRMSKRNGTVVTMEDLVEAVGVDAARYSLVRSSADSALDIDLDLISRSTNDNPVYYVQYAHARTRSVARKAEAAGVTRTVDGPDGTAVDAFDPSLLTHPAESELLGTLEQFPRVIERAGSLREPHRVARYLEELAGTYHRWYDSCRIIPPAGEDIEAVHRTRLVVNEATGQVLRNGLGLLGVTAPERM
ncbi:arginine--tRNA ligase [Amnibacterium sp. CER49]|uniref:arginine--tRNA ligase n=1 Tax=Amnibacterium sp. CER49 TaxID=3039161 RepID=UPI002448FBBB|nr:arginine--tRNA ligase [Amnibacterium sp. CER49]MDH2445108.1 arginine--tRNA ligase [Amnibacterium sp. CER49]